MIGAKEFVTSWLGLKSSDIEMLYHVFCGNTQVDDCEWIEQDVSYEGTSFGIIKINSTYFKAEWYECCDGSDDYSKIYHTIREVEPIEVTIYIDK